MTPHPQTPIWRCPNCGQFYFGDDPPDMCAFCRDFTTWRRVTQKLDDTDQHIKRRYGPRSNDADAPRKE